MVVSHFFVDFDPTMQSNDAVQRSNDAVQRGATDKKGGGRDGGGELGQKLTVDRCRIYISQSAGARIVEIFMLISYISLCFF